MSGLVRADVINVDARTIEPDVERVSMVEHMMRDYLSGEQMHELRDVLEIVFLSCDDGSLENEHYIRGFIDSKRTENCTNRTIRYYDDCVRKCVAYIGKPLRFVDSQDLRRYLAHIFTERRCSACTVNNNYRILRVFFQWLEDEDVIRKSPMRRIKPLREEKEDKKPLTDEDVSKIRDACKTVREHAIVELLLSSGMRLSELCGLDRDSVNLISRECEVYGKGRKRRTCYFSASAKFYLERYMAQRADEEPALFVSYNRPYRRLGKSSIEDCVRELGRRAGVKNVHPHRFRRTFATNNLRRGMRLEEIQQLLGHSRIETTLIYAMVDKDSLAFNARRLS